ncbi:hypothetical protein EDB84DRAFT_1532028 [Lactarius hengduanensis]|nr:hypothetical protein EDB84DRAFT_1532028 [Lactarius hengduanensis]
MGGLFFFLIHQWAVVSSCRCALGRASARATDMNPPEENRIGGAILSSVNTSSPTWTKTGIVLGLCPMHPGVVQKNMLPLLPEHLSPARLVQTPSIELRGPKECISSNLTVS